MAPVESSVLAKECTERLKEGEITKAKELAREIVAKSTENAKEVVSNCNDDVLELLAQGKRNMLCGEVPEAVTKLQEACRLLAEEHGETAYECGEAYMAYGTALLDLSRMESGVLGNALEGAHLDSADESTDDKATTVVESDKITEEEREKISDQVIEAMTEVRPKDNKDKDGKDKDCKDSNDKNVKDKAEKDGKVENKKASPKKDSKHTTDEKNKNQSSGQKTVEESMETEPDLKEGKENAESECTADEEMDGDDGEEVKNATEGNDAKEESEDVSNLQLAWEILELSKVIYNREAKEMKLKAADAHLKLGEIGMETQQYEQALDDFQACVKIQEEYLEPESRLIAESYYQIGVACISAGKYNLALSNLRKAVSVINAKISKLYSLIEEEEKTEKSDAEKGDAEKMDPEESDACTITDLQKEIDDLKKILPEILLKIEDTEEEDGIKDQVKQMVKESSIKGGLSDGSNIKFSEASSNSKPENSAADIGHLVRKKRKPEEDADTTDDSKKSKKETNASVDGRVSR